MDAHDLNCVGFASLGVFFSVILTYPMNNDKEFI